MPGVLRQLVLICGDQTIQPVIGPGSELLLTPGQTLGLQSIAVKTNEGIAVLRD